MTRPPTDRTMVLTFRPEGVDGGPAVWVTLYDGHEVVSTATLFIGGPYLEEHLEPFDMAMLDAMFNLFSSRFPRLL